MIYILFAAYAALVVKAAFWLSGEPLLGGIFAAVVTLGWWVFSKGRMDFMPRFATAILGLSVFWSRMLTHWPQLTTILTIVGGIVGCGLLLRTLWLRRKEAWLPSDLFNARIAIIEKSLYTEKPYKVACKPDRVYQLPDGRMVPVEHKNHERLETHDTDEAQVALQGWILRRNGYKTSEYGYVVVRERPTGRVKAIRVSLRDDNFCEALIRRYIELREGRASPTRASGRKCQKCAHAPVCT